MAIIFFVMGFCTLSFAQQIRFRVVSWNVENLFDIHHDSLKNDREFLPDALRHWNYTRYKKKLTDMARVITAVGEWEPPALVGLCEVENDTVLRDLTRRSPLKELNYRYVMTEALVFPLCLYSAPETVSPHERFVARQWFATDRRHTGRICLPLAKSFRRSKRIRTVPPSCSPNTVHRG